MTALWVAIIVASTSIIGPLLLARYLAIQKRIDREREDAVAAEALRQQTEVAETAERAAKLLLDAQAETIKRSDEVARTASHQVSAQQEATPIILLYPNGQQKEVVLSGVPRAGDRIRLRNGQERAALFAETVLWMEAFLPPPNPSVIVVVRTDVPDENRRKIRSPGRTETGG